MRVVKEAEDRKSEIIEIAAALFAEKGYDQTSVMDIITRVGISKGALYHHFKSKEEILDVMIERQTYAILSAAERVAADTSIPVEERIIRTVMAMQLDQEDGEQQNEMRKQLHKPQNALMHQKTEQIMLKQIPKIFAGILEDGIKQGICHTDYPLECMEMVVFYLNTIMDDAYELPEAERGQKIQAFLYHLERMLDMSEGSLSKMAEAFIS